MNNNYQTILDILNAFLHDQKLVVTENLNWVEISKIIQINSISGIAGFVFEKHTDDRIPQSIVLRFSEDFFSTVTVTTMRDMAMKSLIQQMHEQGIDHLLFKGYVLKDLYTVPELRTFGDIDFGIRRQDRVRSDRFMLENGFLRHDDWEPVYSYEKDFEYYEIHTQLMDSDLDGRAEFKNYFCDFWKHSQKIDEHTYILKPGFHLMYLLTHIAKHLYGSGAGIRMYLDIAFFIRAYKNEIDWMQFYQEVAYLNLEKFVNTVFSALEKWFGVESPIVLNPVDNSFMEQFLEFTLNGGVFGFANKKSEEVELRKKAKGKKIRRISTFLHRAFPSADRLEVRYTYLEGRHWLLPIAWVHRLFVKKQSTSFYLNEVKGFFTADAEKLYQMQKLYENIGL